MNEILFTTPYLLYFIPLILSVLVYFLDGKRFISNISYLFLFILLLLSIKLLKYSNSDTFIVNSTKNFNIIGTEYKIVSYNISFLVLILFINFVGFMNYIKGIILNKISDKNYIKHFFSTYFIYIYSIIGIILTDNIFHLFIFLEIYSFCIYMIISNYKKENLNILSYKYFSTNIFGSILNMLSVFYMIIYFNTNSIFSIKQQLLTINMGNSISVFIIFLVFISSIIIRFFSSTTSRYYNTDYSNINFISISNIFINTLIGIYLLSNIVFYIFPYNFTSYFLFLDKIVIFLSTISIIYNSILMFKYKYVDSIFNLFTRLNLIGLSYIIMIIFLKDTNINLLINFVIDYISTNLLMYFFSNYISSKYNTNKINILNTNIYLKYFFMFLVISKLYLPFASYHIINVNYLEYSIINTNYYLLFPFIINKLTILFILYNIFTDKIQLNPEKIKNDRDLILIISSICIIFVFIIFLNFIF